jgi:dCMP deaminase
MDKNQAKWDVHYLSLAIVTAALSKDPRTKVGAVVVSADGRSLSTGYNGFPIGVAESDAHWEAPAKYDRVIHAEVNAVLNAPFDTAGSTCYCTLSPCHECLGVLINARVARVVWHGQAHPMLRHDILREWLNKVSCMTYSDVPILTRLRDAYLPE